MRGASPADAHELHETALAAAIQRPVPPGHVPVHRWYLRHDEPSRIPAPSPRADLRLVRAHEPSVAFYRFLYDTIGHDWLWGEMRRTNDAAIRQRLQHPGNRLFYPTLEGTPAGMVEAQVGDGATELAYVGLVPGATGRGLGRWMLASACHALMAERMQPFTINTCTSDSPGGLALYLSMGFTIVDETDFAERDPRAEGLIAPHVHSRIPLAK